MKLNVPFYKQKEKYDCGPTALQMVLNYLEDRKYFREEIQELVDSDKSGVTWTIGLAKTAAQLGFLAEFCTLHLGFNIGNQELEFYKQNSDGTSNSQQKLERLKLEAIKFKVQLQEKKLKLKDILNKISSSCVPIILLDWSKIRKTDKFIGHFVPIVGYDSRNVYVHNQGQLEPRAYLAIERKLFEKSRRSLGTDQDIVFIHRKKRI